MSQEFLPLCDVLFNIISLAAYFCDVVFDAVTVYSLYEQKHYVWFTITCSFVMFTQLVCQVCSLRWYMRRLSGDLQGEMGTRACKDKRDCDVGLSFILHILQFGIVVRYLKLLIPVDLKYVKQDVRDLCLLRLIHGYCEAIPMLLIQLYLIWMKVGSSEEISNLNCVSTALSLFSVCWAMASFNKHIRKSNIHKLVMTWMGVIFQFFWRLGTITSRVVSLTIYASLYHHWVLLVVLLHWVCMFCWLIFPKSSEKPSFMKRIIYSSLLAYVYTFCFINVSGSKSTVRMAIFYVVMFLENVLLVGVWIIGTSSSVLGSDDTAPPGYEDQARITALVVASFAGGMVFLLLYYRYFHVSKLKYGYSSNRAPERVEQSDAGAANTKIVAVDENLKAQKKSVNYCRLGKTNLQSGMQTHFNNDLHIPGVFSCRLNRAIKRKKKKPTSFVPPPMVQPHFTGVKPVETQWFKPWWKTSQNSPSDHEGSVGSRVNIQQKLREKKEQQLAELRVIQEEIKQGKIQRPEEHSELMVPVPKNKRAPWLMGDTNPQQNFDLARVQTPEVLLSPYYLDHPRSYGVVPNRRDIQEVSLYPDGSEWEAVGGNKYRVPHVPSDIDSQVSLPRSYTLPREFKYGKRNRSRKVVRAELFVSTNSSDGDVDSAEDDGDSDDEDDGPFSNMPLPLPVARPAIYYYYNSSVRRSSNHETPL
ncbi:unnamed protein product [Notodromas monacha]|uniref:XK-related protein n=1 Tax=Notodromas monacha TaxID=399045 RepID=A0A7R9BGP6_9CRUS|nr:unnamed protein product [Notodromas monacha]CAG0913832.1 unnamed protein product [Notodromas monacha]